MACVKSAVHVRICETAKPFWVLPVQLVGCGGVKRLIFKCRCIWIENALLCPCLLVALLRLNQGIALVGVLNLQSF